MNSEKLKQNFVGYKFPKRGGNRSFQTSWIDTYPWIEYSKSLDAVFCNTCRQYGIKQNLKQDVFVTGYTNWQTTLTKTRGFDRHDDSKDHKNAMLAWVEHKNRKK